jgi:Cys-rich repeat protein
MDRCGPGIACAQDTTCTLDQDTAIKVCKGACEEVVLPCDGACPDTAPICMNDVCVQCTDDGHCDDGETCDINGFCTSSECSGATPYYWDEQCVQCLEDGHCAQDLICNTQTHVCGAEPEACAQCSDPYPACADVGGEIYCVQCTTDEHCGLGGVCNTATYSCEGGTVTPTDACESDADCDPGLTGFDLACETSTGYCYDKNGGCDGITAFCKGGGECLDLLSAFMGGGGGLPGGGLPGMPGGGMTLPGLCPCDIPFIDPNCGSAICLPLGDITGGGGGGGSYCFSL